MRWSRGLRILLSAFFVFGVISSIQVVRGFKDWIYPPQNIFGLIHGLSCAALAWLAFLAGIARRLRQFVLLALSSQLVTLLGAVVYIVVGCWNTSRLRNLIAYNIYNLLIALISAFIIGYLIARHVQIVHSRTTRE